VFFSLSSFSEGSADRPDERLGGHDRWRSDRQIGTEFHQEVSESPEIVQQGGEREAEQPDSAVLRRRLGEKRLHRFVLIFDVPASVVAVCNVHDLFGSDVIAVGHEHGVVAIGIVSSRWDVQELRRVVEFAIDGERNLVLDRSVNAILALDFLDRLVIVFLLRDWRRVHQLAIVDGYVHLGAVEAPT